MTSLALGTPARVRLSFYASRLLSQASQTVFLAALFLAIGSRGPALGVSSALAAMMAAAIVFGFPAGSIGDWFGPRRAFVLGAFLRSGAIGLSLPVIAHVEWVWAIAFVYSAVSQLFTPAELALVSVVHRGQSGRAHTLLAVLQYAGQAIGLFAVAPLLHLLGGLPMMLVGAATLHGVAGITASICALSLGTQAAQLRVSAGRAFDPRQTLRFLVADTRAAYAVALLAFCQLALKSLAVALPPYVRNDLHLEALQIIAVGAISILGVAAGFYWTSRRLTPHLAQRAMKATLLLIVLSLVGLSLLGGSFPESPGLVGFILIEPLETFTMSGYAIALPIAAILALCFTIAPIGARTILTETAPADQQARVFATQTIVTNLIVILPFVFSGLGTQIAGARVTLIVIGMAGLAIFLVMEHLIVARPPSEAVRADAA